MYPTEKSKWRCRECFKYLSSKRSYDEHMNIHNETRPFSCDQCDYSAASQMTLRRHKLRNHTPRQAWGYQCPYCEEAYMEPASYQQHVLIRHFGRSATFGCPHNDCTFTTKSSKHFRNHLKKHIFVMSVRMPSKCFTLQPKYDIAKHLVDDELGSGFGKPPLVPVARRVSASSLRAEGSANDANSRRRVGRGVNVMLTNQDRILASSSMDVAYTCENNVIPVAYSSYNVQDDFEELTIRKPSRSHKQYREVLLPEQEDTMSHLTSSDYADWIEAEVVIDSQPIRLPHGEIEDFELD